MELKDLLISANKRVDEFHEFQKLGLICNNGDYIPAGIHYPQITQYPQIGYEEMYKGYTFPEDGMIDVYVHFPFCSKRCLFCHYPSMYGNNESEKDRYIDALEKEIDIYLRKFNLDKIKLRVALIGGGTPTDLTPKQLERFLKIFSQKCDMTKTRQFNYDVSPHTLIGNDGIERLKILKDYGVNRLTIGIQSMNENVSRLMNRPHTKKEALEAVKNSMNTGFETDIEFIYGFPGQTVESWYEELKEIVQIEADEYQFYRLMVDAFGDRQGLIKQYQENHPEERINPDNTIRMKQMIFDYLESFGLKENIRRVFTRKKSCISLYAFNQCCRNLDQVGFGLTGFSSLRDRFVLNTKDFEMYYSMIEEGKLPYDRGYVRDEIAQQRWAIILPLKNYYIKKRRYKEVTGTAIENTRFYPIIQNLKTYGFIEENDDVVRLTDKGIFFSDDIVLLFYETKFIPKGRELFNDGPLNPYAITSLT